jgi:tetratricopeptide (TPR) repeat protein
MLATMAAVLRVGVMASVEHPSGTTIHWPFALVELDVFRRYLGLLLLPLNQTIFHAIAPLRSVFHPRAILAVFTVAAYVFLIIRLRRVDGLASFGLAWFALLLIPSAVLVVLDRGEPMAEHRVYLASAGFFMAVGTIAVLIRARIGRLNGVGSRAARRAPAVGLLVVALLCVRTISRNIVWSRPVSLWLEAAEYAPDHWLPRLALGEALHEQGRHEEAIVSLRAALALRPEEALGYAKLGLCLIETGRLVEASATFEGLRRLDPRSPVAAAGLGLVAARTGDSILARRFFVEALELDPRSVPVRQSLAEMAEASDPGEALRLCEEIRQLAPETPGNEECIRRNRARLAGGR